MIKNWMTIEECEELFRKKKPNITRHNVVNILYRRRVKKIEESSQVGRPRKDYSINQRWLEADVFDAFDRYKPNEPLTYRISTPPPDGWYKLRYIAEHLGVNLVRLSHACSMLAIPARMYKNRRYANLDTCKEYLPWRSIGFVRSHRSDEWIAARLKLQKEKRLKPPFHMTKMKCRSVFAPELIHL